MNLKFVALILLSSLEAFLIFLIWKKLRKKTNQISYNEILLKKIENIFQKNDFHLKIDKLEELGDAIKMYELKIQNEEYERAEFRVYEKFDIFLNELWRLKKEEKNELASKLLILLRNTLSLEYEDEHRIKYNSDVEKKYRLVSKANENDDLEIIRPVWLMNGKVIIKGKVKRI